MDISVFPPKDRGLSTKAWHHILEEHIVKNEDTGGNLLQ
jgi:hypothetical protein